MQEYFLMQIIRVTKNVHKISPAVALPPTSNNGFDVDSNNYNSAAAMAVAGGATEQEDNNGTANNTRESLPTTSKNAPNGGM